MDLATLVPLLANYGVPSVLCVLLLYYGISAAKAMNDRWAAEIQAERELFREIVTGRLAQHDEKLDRIEGKIDQLLPRK